MMFERQHFLGLVELRRQAPSWGWNSNNLASPFLCIPDTLSGTLSNGYDKRIYVWWTGTDSLNIIPLLRGHLIWDSHRLGVGRDWGAHIWRDTTGNTGSLLLRTILMTEIQYNIDFSIQPCTQDIYYMPKKWIGANGSETKLNTDCTVRLKIGNYNERLVNTKYKLHRNIHKEAKRG